MKPIDEYCRKAIERIYLVSDRFELCGYCFDKHIDEQFKNEFYTTTTIQHVLTHYQTKYLNGYVHCNKQV